MIYPADDVSQPSNKGGQTESKAHLNKNLNRNQGNYKLDLKESKELEHTNEQMKKKFNKKKSK